MPRGYLALVLHAHLPFVRHPEHPSVLEETWLFEAITEVYLPLLACLERLVAEGLPVRLTVSLSPTLVAMLQDDLLQRRYLAHAERTLALAEAEVARTRGDARLHPVARLYRTRWEEAMRRFEEDYRRDLTRGFARLADAGAVELITTAATHAFLPLLRSTPGMVSAQLQVAARSHQATFGAPPAGLWLPECGYYPGLEEQVAAAGLRYFFVEAHGLWHASPPPRAGVYAPADCPNGVAVFARDPETSRRVWSAEQGYPGDPWYRDFYRDIGFDLPIDALRPFLADGETRAHTGLKYYRVTDRTEPKAPYEPERAAERVRVHAQDFLRLCRSTCEQAARSLSRPPIVTAPYDAELLGHWWFEGPQWLEQVLRLAARGVEGIALTSPGDDLSRYPERERTRPAASTWGEGGYNEFWLNEGNDWVYPHLHAAARRLAALARDFADVPPGSLAGRALRQAARSLLLAQASDWAFLMRAGTAPDYAGRRTRDHLARARYLEAGLRAGRIDPLRLAAIEELDRIFPDLDPRPFAAGPPALPAG
jgi:1,4-alpha-glucan branching enzyme